MTAPFRSLLGSFLLLEAKRRRALGGYSRATLWVYLMAWKATRSPHALLQFCLFRHELGYGVSGFLESDLRAIIPELAAKDRSVAEALTNPARRMEQANLRLRFSEWLAGTGNRKIAVVGNGAALAGSRKAGAIESSDCVIRFNYWCAAAEDVGTRTNLWVRSPLDIAKAESPRPVAAPNWQAVSGPDMASRRPEWETWCGWNGCRLVAFPLDVWCGLVDELLAPPSAGLLTLKWIRKLRGTWEGITAFGMGYTGGRYHVSIRNHRASHRHNWPAENAILAKWVGEGLRIQNS